MQRQSWTSLWTSSWNVKELACSRFTQQLTINSNYLVSELKTSPKSLTSITTFLHPRMLLFSCSVKRKVNPLMFYTKLLFKSFLKTFIRHFDTNLFTIYFRSKQNRPGSAVGFFNTHWVDWYLNCIFCTTIRPNTSAQIDKPYKSTLI